MLPREIKPATFASAKLIIHPNWVYELKYDGFRALAYVENGTSRLVSRNGSTFASFASLAQAIADSIRFLAREEK